MKFFTRTLSFLLVLAFLTAPAQANKIRLGLILEKQNNDNLDEQILNSATTAFLSSKRFILAERERLDAVFDEKGLKGFIGDQEGSRLEETLGLEMLGLVSYSVSQQRNHSGEVEWGYTIAVRLTDVATGEVFATVDSKRPGIALAPSPMLAGDDLLDNLRGLFPPEGYVIQVSEQKAVVDLGSTMGIEKGDILEVVELGPPVIHPVTGRELPGPESVVAVLKVERVNAELSTCRVKSADTGIEVGNQVRYKDKKSMFKMLKRAF